MPDEDERFGDVADQLKQTETSDEETESDTEEEFTEVEELEEVVQETGLTDEQVEPVELEESGGPAFSFDETNMHGFYVRNETWDRVTRMRSSVTAACSMFDVPEFEGREFQDACLQVVADHGEEVALQILRERDIEADEDRVQEVVEMLRSRTDQ